MTQPAAIQATFYDWRTVKSRKMLQLVFEVPIEQMEDVMRTIGTPMPHKDIWCAIARLDLKDGKAPKRQDEKPRCGREWYVVPRSEQAGILCADPKFQKWLGARDEKDAAIIVREACAIDSRAKLDEPDNYAVASIWDNMVLRYRSDTGQTTERLW